MQLVLAVTVPFFALVVLGWLAARLGKLPESAIPGLNAYVLWFALPCMLFRFGSSLPLATLVDPWLLGLYLAIAVVLVSFTIAVTRQSARRPAGVGMKDAGLGALVAAFPNAGFMGVPLLVALLGPAAAGPVIGAILVDLVVTSTLCLALASTSGAGTAADVDRRRIAAGWAAFKAGLSNPLPWAIAAGAAFHATDRVLPAPLDAVVRMLGDSATPVALFTIGAVLERAGRHAHTRTPLSRVLDVTVIKLVLHPALVFGGGSVLVLLGAPIPAFGLMVLTLSAALPSASNVSILAERMGADNGRIARIILATTVLAFLSFSFVAWLFLSRSPASFG